MKTFHFCYRSIFFVITCFSCCCCITIASNLPTTKINETNKVHNGTIEVIFHNKTVLTHALVELVCAIKPKTFATVLWMKEDEKISQNNRVKFEGHKLIFNQTTESDAGYYTCIVKTAFGIQNRTAYLAIIEDQESEEEVKDGGSGGGKPPDPCGSAEKRQISHCYNKYDFSNCKSFAPSVNVNDIEIIQTVIKNSSRINMKIQWKIPKAGNTDIWGWQIVVADVDAYPGDSDCVQLNRKYLWESKDGDLYASHTFNDRFRLETEYKVVIKSLPALDNKRNSVATRTSTKLKDYCSVKSESKNCCYKVKNVAIEQVGKSSANLSWPDLASSTFNAELLSAFIVQYNSTYMNNPCQEGIFVVNIEDALNKSHIIIQNLVPRCQNYSFQITPVFNDSGCEKCGLICDETSKKGKSSEYYLFRIRIVEKTAKYYSIKQTNVLKAVIVVAVVLAVTVLLTVVIIFCKKKRAFEKAKEAVKISDGRPVTEVFVVHGSHCKDCEDAVLSVVTYLNLTGLCKCSIDLCSLPKEWSPGMTQYYENKIAKCQKVIVLFTVNENCECEDNVKARNFTYQKNLIRSELYANCPTAKFIPVYMDFLSVLDIPCFLRNKKSFSLPTQLTELVLYIIGEPVCKPLSVCPMLSVEEDSSLMKHKKIMEAKINNLNAKHQKKFKTKNNNMLAKIV